MTWLRNPFTRPRKTGRPQPSGWCVDNESCIAPNWYPIGEALVRQCDSCGYVSAVITQAPAPVTGLRHARWIAAIQPTDDRPADGWPGCLD